MKVCERCKKEYEGHGLKYCGLIATRTGCAWQVRKQKKREQGLASYHRRYPITRGVVCARARAYRKQWGPEEKARKLQWDREYRARYPDRVIAMQRRYYERNKEKILKYTTAYGKAHPWIGVFFCKQYRHRKRANGGRFSLQQWREVLSAFNNTCPGCGRNDVPMSQDHKIPICKGGTNTIDNIQPLCRPCNSSKYKTILFAACNLVTRRMYLTQGRQVVMNNS